MAFSPVDLPIQEILETDWITDIQQISNSNVLIIKDKIEDLMNNFEMDTNTISIGTSNPINSIKTQDLIIQDGGFIFQTGVPNQIIARLAKNGSGESVLTVNNINVDTALTASSLNSENLVISSMADIQGDVEVSGALKYTSSMVESKEVISSLLEFETGGTGDTAKTTITLTSDSKRNIYVTLSAETTLGSTQVWSGSALNPSMTNIKIVLDFDADNPPAPNTTFTIHVVDVLENGANTSILSDINIAQTPLSIVAGVNNSTTNSILLHNDFETLGRAISINYASSDLLSQALYKHGSNATFNYTVDDANTDRLIITSFVGFEII